MMQVLLTTSYLALGNTLNVYKAITSACVLRPHDFPGGLYHYFVLARLTNALLPSTLLVQDSHHRQLDIVLEINLFILILFIWCLLACFPVKLSHLFSTYLLSLLSQFCPSLAEWCQL